MRIRPIACSDDAFSRWYAAFVAGQMADLPQGPRHTEREQRVLHESSEHRDTRLWLAEHEGQTLGAAGLSLPLRDNLKLAEPEVWVPPEARRQGVGSALLQVLSEAAGEHGRTSLLSIIDGPSDRPDTPGTLFAEHHGFTRRITEIMRVQRPPFDLDAVARAETEARPHAAGYQILTWRDRVPDEHVKEYARLEGRLSTDAPLGELDYEGEVWDEARIRDSEERRHRMGRCEWSAAALAPDGSMAGLTRVTLAEHDDESGLQDTTLVDPAHRGHRLGLLLKAANFRRLLEDCPGLRAVWTWNAESNTNMISINETLGYRVEGWSAGYQRDL